MATCNTANSHPTNGSCIKYKCESSADTYPLTNQRQDQDKPETGPGTKEEILPAEVT
jgi:hypothetical protein